MMPQTEAIFGKFDPTHPRTVVRRDFIGDEIYEERELDLAPYDDPLLEDFIDSLHKAAEGMDNPRVTQHEQWGYDDDHPRYTYALWHTRPATALELQIAQGHRAKEAAKAKKYAEAQKKSIEASERKQYQRLKKKYG